jgi:hypothetical protein
MGTFVRNIANERNVMKNFTLVLAVLAASASAVSVSSSAQTSAPIVIGAEPDKSNTLLAGTTVRLRTLSALNSNDSKVGQIFDIETSEDVLLNGIIVIPRGTRGRGEVTFAKKKGMWGKSGKLETRLLSVRLNGRDIPIRGSVGDKGETGTVGVVAAIAFIPVAGFFVTGTSANLPEGSPATGYIESDIPISFAPKQ